MSFLLVQSVAVLIVGLALNAALLVLTHTRTPPAMCDFALILRWHAVNDILSILVNSAIAAVSDGGVGGAKTRQSRCNIAVRRQRGLSHVLVRRGAVERLVHA